MTAEAGKYLREGSTITYIALNDEIIGFIALSDTIREESSQMISKLMDLGVEPVLLTGDNQNAAEAIAKQLGIKDIHAGCMPEDKLNCIDSYQKNGCEVCMIGDGINDAPALKKANVGIAMGGIGLSLIHISLIAFFIVLMVCHVRAYVVHLRSGFYDIIQSIGYRNKTLCGIRLSSSYV